MMIYNIDIIVCLDLTNRKAVEIIKKFQYQYLLPDIEQALNSCNKHADKIRIKIISFCDLNNCDHHSGIIESRFFNLTDNNSLDPNYYDASIKHLKHLAVLDRFEKTNALEAIAIAIKSEWIQEGDKCRHVIVMFTDAPTHKLEEANTSNPNYPAEMPTSLAELGDLWNNTSADGNQVSKTKLKQPAKRLIIFAPQEYPWSEIYENWEQVVYNPAHPGEGLDDVSYDDIINSIVGSI